MIKIATWNVNSVKARLPNIVAWLREVQPDIVLLQEIKTLEENFPTMEIEDLGYNLMINGQKTYNGVAILSKFPIYDVIKRLPGDDSDQEARYIEGVIAVGDKALRVASIYVPNGQQPGSDKFLNKIRFFDRLRKYAAELLTCDEIMVLGGDYNVAPSDIDVYDPKHLRGTTCFHPDEQERFRALLYTGLTDAYRMSHPDTQEFSWWDYRGGGYQNNKGMRIDHLLLSAQAADRLVSCTIDEEPRGKEKSSDHTPVLCELVM